MDLFEWLKENNMSKKDFAEDFGICYTYMSKLKRGILRMSIKKAKQLEQFTKGQVTAKEMRPDIFENVEH